MLLADSLVVIGLATVSLGTIREADGPLERSFWLRNDGTSAVTLLQGYTSCGCTTIGYDRNKAIEPGDSTAVVLHFNPRGKGGEFLESATVEYGKDRRRLQLALEGTCITSEETLLRQFPIRLNEQLRLSNNHFDLGYLSVGDTCERHVVVLHRDENNRQESLTVRFTVTPDMPRGLQKIVRPVTISSHPKNVTAHITFDVFIKQ